LLRTATANKAFKLVNGILPDFAIDARGTRYSGLLQFTDSSRLDGVETLVDIKGVGIGESSDYASFRAEQGQLKPIDHRAVKVHKAYCKAAKDIDSKYNHTPDDEIGPLKSALLSFGPVAGKYKGKVFGLGIGCFGEFSAGSVTFLTPPLSGEVGSRQQKQRLRAPRRRSRPPSRVGCRRSGRLDRPRPSALPRRFCVHRAQSCVILRGSLRRHVAQGGPGHVPLTDPPRLGSLTWT